METKEELGFDYDSNDEISADVDVNEDENGEKKKVIENNNPESFSWAIMRLALVQQHLYRLKQFVTLAGFDLIGMLFIFC